MTPPDTHHVSGPKPPEKKDRDTVPVRPPVPPPRRPHISETNEDSFPASDPPSWSPTKVG